MARELRTAAALVLTVAVASPARAARECKPDQRLVWGSLRCADGTEGGWYQIDVEFGCAVARGRKQTEIQVRQRDAGGASTVMRTLRAGQVQSFVMDRLLNGERTPKLFTTVLPGGKASEKVLCDESTRAVLGTLTCGETTLETHVMCRTYLGIPSPHLLIVEPAAEGSADVAGRADGEHKENRFEVRATLPIDQAFSRAREHVGERRLQILSRKLPGKGRATAEALLQPDGGPFEWVEMKIEPGGGGESCTKMVDVKRLWLTRYQAPERRGYLEARAVVSADGRSIVGVELVVSPLGAPECKRIIDIGELWAREWQ